jgi:hypothetical protein
MFVVDDSAVSVDPTAALCIAVVTIAAVEAVVAAVVKFVVDDSAVSVVPSAAVCTSVVAIAALVTAVVKFCH